MNTVSVKYKSQTFDVIFCKTHTIVRLWWIRSNRWGQDEICARELKTTDKRFDSIVDMAKETQ
jgi:hypothetical protein